MSISVALIFIALTVLFLIITLYAIHKGHSKTERTAGVMLTFLFGIFSVVIYITGNKEPAQPTPTELSQTEITAEIITTIEPTPAITTEAPPVDPLAALPRLNRQGFTPVWFSEYNQIYTGPGEEYYCCDEERPSAMTSLDVYGKKYGWAFVSYYSGRIRDTAYGWISGKGLKARALENVDTVDFANVSLVIRKSTYATEGPNDHPEILACFEAGVVVTGLARLDNEWVYCEFHNDRGTSVMGLIPADAFYE